MPMKIYTRKGDDGSTQLLGPDRVLKNAVRVEAYGTVDELNAVMGVARTLDTEGWLTAEIETIQSLLFHVGAELAAPSPAALEKLERITDEDVLKLERWIDRHEATLPPLTSFLLPGGTPLAAELQLARTVCRRAERRVVTLRETEAIDLRIVRFLNRLADLLFVLARWCNHRAGVPALEWHGRAGSAD